MMTNGLQGRNRKYSSLREKNKGANYYFELIVSNLGKLGEVEAISCIL